MPLIVAKLLSEDNLTDLDTAVAAYKAGAGSDLVDKQRGMDACEFIEPDGDWRRALILAHGGLDIPASGAKTADLQHVNVNEQGNVADLQSAVDAALAQVEHLSVADADTTVAGKVTTAATTPFAAEDVGRIIEIGGVQKVITVYNANNDVDYDNSDGDFASGSGLTMKQLGAEVLQSVNLRMHKSRSGNFRMFLAMALEGEAY